MTKEEIEYHRSIKSAAFPVRPCACGHLTTEHGPPDVVHISPCEKCKCEDFTEPPKSRPDIAALKVAEAKAKKGPWYRKTPVEIRGTTTFTIDSNAETISIALVHHDPTAEFIVALRNAFPALCETLERYEAALTEIKEVVIVRALPSPNDMTDEAHDVYSAYNGALNFICARARHALGEEG